MRVSGEEQLTANSLGGHNQYNKDGEETELLVLVQRIAQSGIQGEKFTI